MNSHTRRAAVVVILAILAGASSALAQMPIRPLHSFSGNVPGQSQDGAIPLGGLVLGSDGYLYGTTSEGGSFNLGTIFRVLPDGTLYETIYSFSGASSDGASPRHGALCRGGDGNLYGTTWAGGSDGLGTFFRVEPLGTPIVTTLYEFGPDSPHPEGGLTLVSDGYLYGTASGDAATGNFGAIFRIGVDGADFQTVYTFWGGSDGATPTTGVIEGPWGYLYGTTEGGLTESGGTGTVFRVATRNRWDFTVLAEGAGPASRLILGPDNYTLYGAYFLSPGSAGSVFRIQPDGTGFETLHAFDGADAGGTNPLGSLLLGSDGYLYGTTTQSPSWPAIAGSVFRLSTDGATFETLHVFGVTDGGFPAGNLVQLGDWNIYGTTSVGGNAVAGLPLGAGTAFVIDMLQIELAGQPLTQAYDTATFTLALRNTSTVDLPGPFFVYVVVDPALTSSAESTGNNWTCTPDVLGRICTYSGGLPAGGVTETHSLTHDVGPGPYTSGPGCGFGPSPCVLVAARIAEVGRRWEAVTGVVTVDPWGVLNHPPQAVDDAATLVWDVVPDVTVNVLANDVDADGNWLEVTEIVTPPSQGTVVINPDGTLTYTVTAQLTSPDQFRYRIDDHNGATATALVTITPGVFAMTLSKTILDVGQVGAGRLAAGRILLRGNAPFYADVSFEDVPAADIATLIAGTGYDPNQAVSAPQAFQSSGCGTSEQWPCPLSVFFRPSPTPGDVFVARAVFAVHRASSIFTNSVIVVGQSVTPALAPIIAADDVVDTAVDTPVRIPVVANDVGRPGKNLRVSSWWAYDAYDTAVPYPYVKGTVQPAPGFLNDILFTPTAGFSGTTAFSYSISEEEIVGPNCPSPCWYQNTMYFATVTVHVGGAGFGLNVSRAGTGTGTVTAASVGIDCGAACSVVVPSGTAVTLTATADAGSGFTGWSGACSGMGSCDVTVTSPTNVTATFTRQGPDLAVVKSILEPGLGAVAAATVGVGATVTFSLEAINAGAGATTGPITVTDNLPPELTFVAAGSDARCAAVGQVVTCTDAGPILHHGSVSFVVVAQLDPAVGASGRNVQVANTATVATPDDANAANDTSAPVTLTVVAPEFSVYKTAIDPATNGHVTALTVANGATVEFHINVVNGMGGGPVVGDVTVTDTLPADLTFVAAGSDPRCAVSGQVVTCIYSGPFGPRHSEAFVVNAQVGPNVAGIGQTVQRFNTAAVSTPFIGRVSSQAVTVDVQGPAGAPTGTGTRVEVQPTDASGVPQPITLTFSSVTGPGVTTATPLPVPPQLPANFAAAGLAYQITTTAQFVPPIRVCFSGGFGLSDWLLHFEGGIWVKLPNQARTPVGDPPYSMICADTNSLSPFVAATQQNNPPTADAGSNQTVEATSPAGAMVTLSGSGTDPDGDALSFAWSGPCGAATGASVVLPCPMGASTMTLTVTDSWGLSATASVTITVRDTPPPSPVLTARAAGKQVQLTWTNANAAGYAIYRGTTSGGPYVRIAQTPGTQLLYLDANRTIGATYYWVVRSLAANQDELAQSNQVMAKISGR